MSLTITQANAVNTVLHWITGQGGGPHSPTENQARAAAAELAQHAHRALGAGFDQRRLLAAWPMPIGVCSLCPTRVPAAELVPHIREMHPGVLGETVDGLPVVDVNDAPARPAVRDFRDEPHDVDWASVAVGDVDPTADISWPCGDRLDEGESGLWSCTRPAGHTEVHVAGDGSTVCAVWG